MNSVHLQAIIPDSSQIENVNFQLNQAYKKKKKSIQLDPSLVDINLIIAIYTRLAF